MLKIAITDDEARIADLLEKSLKENNDIDIVFIASNGKECVEKLQALPSNALPEIILMDISMPKMTGIEATKLISAAYPQIAIIIFTVLGDEDSIVEAIKVGAKGYLLKTESKDFIIQTIEEVKKGGSQLSPTIARKMLNIFQRTNKNEESIAEAPHTLSKREAEILAVLKEGKSYKAIASTLNISLETVKKHIRNIYVKLEAHNKLEAISKNKK